MKYLDPKADLTFKKVFGEHPDLVLSLLNALLPFPPEELITDVEYLTPEMVVQRDAYFVSFLSFSTSSAVQPVKVTIVSVDIP